MVSCLSIIRGTVGIKKRLLVGGWLSTSSMVISIGTTASVCYREVVRLWEGPLWEVPLYSFSVAVFFIRRRCFQVPTGGQRESSDCLAHKLKSAAGQLLHASNEPLYYTYMHIHIYYIYYI